MKRFLRVLVVTGGAFLLLLGTRTRVAAQLRTSDGSCCDSSKAHSTTDLPCGHCTVGGYGQSDSRGNGDSDQLPSSGNGMRGGGRNWGNRSPFPHSEQRKGPID